MSKKLALVAICCVLGLATFGLASSRPTQQDKDKDNDSQARHAPRAANLKITHGPVLESVGDNLATIAWSTNVNASTILKYGTNPSQLSETAEAPWGGVTHRVHLRGLRPGTTYYYRIESTQAQGTGTQAISTVEQFRTRGAAAPARPAQAANTVPPGRPAQAANTGASGRDTALRNFHEFLVAHPNVKADLQKDPNLTRNGRYVVQHPAFAQFLQTHPLVRAYLAQNPSAFMQSETLMR